MSDLVNDVTAMTPQAKKTRVSDVVFVESAISANSYADLANLTGLSPLSAAARCRRLRKAGVLVPEYDRPRKVLDVEALNNLIARV